MLSIKSIVSIEVNGRKYEFSCAPDSPLPDVIEANMQINAFLVGRQEQARLALEQAKQAEQEAPKE